MPILVSLFIVKTVSPWCHADRKQQHCFPAAEFSPQRRTTRSSPLVPLLNRHATLWLTLTDDMLPRNTMGPLITSHTRIITRPDWQISGGRHCQTGFRSIHTFHPVQQVPHLAPHGFVTKQGQRRGIQQPNRFKLFFHKVHFGNEFSLSFRETSYNILG